MSEANSTNSWGARRPPSEGCGLGADSPQAPCRLMNTKESPLVSAIWNDATIATSNETVVVEGNHYFPPSAVDFGRLR